MTSAVVAAIAIGNRLREKLATQDFGGNIIKSCAIAAASFYQTISLPSFLNGLLAAAGSFGQRPYFVVIEFLRPWSIIWDDN